MWKLDSSYLSDSISPDDIYAEFKGIPERYADHLLYRFYSLPIGTGQRAVFLDSLFSQVRVAHCIDAKTVHFFEQAYMIFFNWLFESYNPENTDVGTSDFFRWYYHLEIISLLGDDNSPLHAFFVSWKVRLRECIAEPIVIDRVEDSPQKSAADRATLLIDPDTADCMGLEKEGRISL